MLKQRLEGKLLSKVQYFSQIIFNHFNI